LTANPGSILVKIHWTGTRASDRNDCSGRYGSFGNALPFCAGYEAVGRVLQLGWSAKRLKVGDAVGMLLMKRGGASEYNVVPEDECFVLPAALPDFITFFNAGCV
jgi:NADPH:quinone reductase-like Zn-dependent oxidoreductase